MESQGSLDSSSELSMECLWFCFSGVLQEDLNFVKDHWNTHVIRKSRHETVAGRPDSLYYLPEYHGGMANLLVEVTPRQIDYVAETIVKDNESNDYQEYFDYARRALGITLPSDWQGAYKMYQQLMHVAESS